MNTQNMGEEDACLAVFGNEFPVTCGRACDPRRCDAVLTAFPTIAPHTPTLTFDSSMYCFPAYNDRTRFTNVWGNYVVEVKEGVCGPDANTFTTDTVKVEEDTSGNNDELTLQYKYVPVTGWEGSEVRVVLPDAQMPFKYGTYKFSVKSIVHRNTKTGLVVSNVLPPSLILGLFTWDTTDSYDVHENWNHEVDIEISRWGIRDNKDVQFLVQPPEQPQWYRFQSDSDINNLDQAGHTYEFLWNPGSIHWSTTAGGGQTHSYSTELAIQYGVPDRVQCLPADIEIRMNLWNLGGIQAPMDMGIDDIVEVVIDSFTYTPSGLTHVDDGGHCTKHCQCKPSSLCVGGLCIPNP